MATGSDNQYPKIVLVEQGSTPATPDAGTQKLFIDNADHHLKRVDESDVVTDIESVLVQRVISEDGAVATGTTVIPIDDTIPQNTEGTQFLSVTITPTNASNILYIDVNVFAGNSAGSQWMMAALFQDSVANALAAGMGFAPTGTGITPIHFVHKMVAGGTSAITFKVRIGANAAGTTTFNGISGARYLGGVLASSISVSEQTP